MEWDKVIYADCMNDKNGLPTLEDKSIDLGITDPPWNVNFKGTKRNKEKENYKKYGKVLYPDNFEDFEKWNETWFNEINRICNNIIIIPGNKNLKTWINYKEPYDIMIWYKKNSPGRGRAYHFIAHEFILLYGNFGKKYNHSVIESLLWRDYPPYTFKHPTPKPMKLWYNLIKGINPKSVIDPFIGSGTTAEVCTKLGIPWLGYEINEVYSHDIDLRLKNCKKEPQQKSIIEVY